MKDRIRIAVQKSGRLSDSSIQLIKECGIHFNNGKGNLKAVSHTFPAEFLFLRDDDIPGYVEDGVADIGIVGENVMLEKGKDVSLIKRLGFSKCRLSLAIARDKEYKGLQDFEGVNIATSYPVILKRFLTENGITAHLHEISGSVEIAPSIGLAEAVCDIVSSGSTLLSNGLKEVETILKSEAVLIGHKSITPERLKALDQLIFRINAVQKGSNNKYVLLNAPVDKTERIIEILPGMRSPTVLPLAMSGWNSVHSVIKEDEFWDVIEQLKAAGAEGILVVPIEKMIL
ncbi:ATP phosphoribosyltransferase [Catalinimonas niigatensis]|uniref:ATP phosphoribosyltransferase n=1 Tax=Catalinimonas niigatensis TaxID=1397264 RepID=UPI00266662D1|nr:ATP phosphoribosyltransferase [Catalinimonas niigatensis]WPP49583.1 ATP phosphoribosyltransferase [Catalinimonas niigatensis]